MWQHAFPCSKKDQQQETNCSLCWSVAPISTTMLRKLKEPPGHIPSACLSAFVLFPLQVKHKFLLISPENDQPNHQHSESACPARQQALRRRRDSRNHNLPQKINQLIHRVQMENPPKPLRPNRIRIKNRRRIRPQERNHAPQESRIAEENVQRRHHQRHAQRKQKQKRNHQRQQRATPAPPSAASAEAAAAAKSGS